MTKPLPHRHLLFLEGLASGMTYIAACKAAGYKPRHANAANMQGWRILRNPVAREKLEELQRAAAAKCAFKRENLAAWLIEVLETSADRVGAGHRLLQDYVSVQRGKDEVPQTRTKMVGKVEAAKLLVAMMGWRGPEKKGAEEDRQSWSELVAGLPRWVPGDWDAERHGDDVSKPVAGGSSEAGVQGREVATGYEILLERVPRGREVEDDEGEEDGGSFKSTPGPMPWDHARPGHITGAFDHREVKAVGGSGSFRLSDGRRV